MTDAALIDFWAGVLGLALLLYVVLDGFDLGVGLLFPFAPDTLSRQRMMDAISPVWDGNETWLVISGATLFAAFPEAYGILLSAFYLPVIAMLCGLILRGVAFEFRGRTERFRWFWSLSFFAGSLVASFMQGTAIGAFVQELPVTPQGVYTGSLFAWASPFALLCGVGLCLGYALLGAGWLTHKTEDDVRDFGYRLLPPVLAGVVLFLIVAGIAAFAMDLRVTHAWRDRPALFALPAVGGAALLLLMHAVRRRRDRMIYPCGMIMFVCAFATMVLSLLPFIVPFAVTLSDAAAPPATLSFLFWGAGIVIMPVTLIYTAVVYAIFRGKVRPTSDIASSDIA